MNSEALRVFYEKTTKIPGWLSSHDAAVINSILSSQSKSYVSGDLLEIGVYAGRSAVLLGQHVKPNEKLHVCDIFDGETDIKNSEEIIQSYKNLSRARFESNCLEFIGFLPTIHQCPSLELPNLIGDNLFRFIHIDGSHLYEHVKTDLDFAVSSIEELRGVIAVDDFRAQHTVGVAVAVWDLVLQGKVVPLVMTSAKIYLGHPKIIFDKVGLEKVLQSMGIEALHEEILGHDTLRTIGLSDHNMYAKTTGLVRFVPPILGEFIRNSYLWKRFRNR